MKFLFLILLIVIIAAFLWHYISKRKIGGGGDFVTSGNIEKETMENNNWRKVIATGDGLQVALMSTPPKNASFEPGELGWEVHKDSDQFFRVESGTAVLEVGPSNGDIKKQVTLNDGSFALVPRGTWHNVRNISSTKPLKMYVLYGPPHHPSDRVDATYLDEKKRHELSAT